MPDLKKAAFLSETSRKALENLPSAHAVAILDDLLGKVADNNNANNFSEPAALSRDEMVKKLHDLPDSQLKAVLKSQGIL